MCYCLTKNVIFFKVKSFFKRECVVILLSCSVCSVKHLC